MYNDLKTLHPGGIRTRDLLFCRRTRWPMYHAARAPKNLPLSSEKWTPCLKDPIETCRGGKGKQNFFCATCKLFPQSIHLQISSPKSRLSKGSGKVVKMRKKWNWEDPGSLPTPGNLLNKKSSLDDVDMHSFSTRQKLKTFIQTKYIAFIYIPRYLQLHTYLCTRIFLWPDLI
jgi:hypothetical protein